MGNTYESKQHRRSREKLVSLRALFSKFLYYVKRKELKSEISFDEYCVLITMDCYFCGKPPSNSFAAYYKPILYQGIDRIDPAKGYEKTNVIPCCKICNFMKARTDISKFFNQTKKIATRKSSERARIKRLLNKLLKNHT